MSINDREYWSGSTTRTIIETGNACHTRHRIKTKQIQQKPTQANTKHKQTQNTLIGHEPSYKQQGVKTNQPSFACGNQQHGTQSVKTHNKRTQNTKKMSNTDLNDG
jgi:hypothetical protein